MGDTRTGPHAETETAAPSVDWGAVANGFATYRKRHKPQPPLAVLLGLGQDAIRKFPFIGYDPAPEKWPHAVWTFPEQDASGNVIGIYLRDETGRRGTIKDSKRGLMVPVGWRENAVEYGYLLITEGGTDTIAATAAGLPCIGRPSASGGGEHLEELLINLQDSVRVIVVGDNDKKENGKFPGKDGAEKIARHLTDKLHRSVWYALAPNGYKDVREWLTAPARGETPWVDRGKELLNHLRTVAITVPPVGTTAAAQPPKVEPLSRIVTEPLSHLKGEPIDWLVPNRIPRGELVLIAADGGKGKSTTMRHLAAKITTGEPAFGLSYVPDEKGKVMYFGVEDDYGSVVLPSLIAEGADLDRIHREAFTEKIVKGKVVRDRFGLDDIDPLERLLRDLSDVRLVVIDPIASFVGRAKIDDHRASELRTLLEPLVALAKKSRVTIVLLAHTNKGGAERAVHRIAGSTAYSTAVRLAYMMDDYPADPTVRLLMPVKWNIPDLDQTAIASRLVKVTEGKEAYHRLPNFNHLTAERFERVSFSRLEFDSPKSVTADRVMCRDTKSAEGAERKNRIQRCADRLRLFLKDYAHPVAEVNAALSNEFTIDTIAKAKTLLKPEGLVSSPIDGFQTPWWLGFGPVEKWVRRPEQRADTLPDQTPHTPNTHNTPNINNTHNTGNTSGFPDLGDSGVLCNSGESGISRNGKTQRLNPVGHPLRNVTIPPEHLD